MLTFVEAIHALEDGPGGRNCHGIRRMCWDDGIIVLLSGDGRLSFTDPHGIQYTLESDDVAAYDWVVRPLPRHSVDESSPASGLTFAEAVAHLRAHPADTARRAAWETAVAEPGVPFYGFISVDDGTIFYNDRDGDAYREMDDAFEHVLANDWVIVPNPAAKTPPTGGDAPKTMGLTLAEAVGIAEAGNYRIRRADWSNKNYFVKPLMYQEFCIEDSISTDWEVVP